MDEEAEASLPPSLVEDSARADMDHKENLCTIPEDDPSEPSLCKEMPVRLRRKQKGGGCNLRKSLAWNKAFFTEQGVLDPVELSVLSGSLTKSDQEPLSGINGGGMSPLTEFSLSSGRPTFQDFEGKACGKGPPKPQRKDTNVRELFSKSEGPLCEETPVHTVSGKIPVVKGIARSMPQAPIAYSQKRVANAIPMNPTSKIPRFVTTKTCAAPLPTPSMDVMLTAKRKSKQTNVLQTASVRSSSCSTRDSGYTSSTAKSSVHDAEKHNPKAGKHSSTLMAIPDSSVSTKLNGPPTCSGFCKALSSFPQNLNHVSGCAPAPVHPKPSALRMPSPTLGFFSQGKVSPSQSSQTQRYIKPSSSDIPNRKDINLGDLKPLPMLNGKKPATLTAAAQFNSEGDISKSIQATSAANCKDSSVATPDMHKVPKSNLEMKQRDDKDRKDSNNFIISYYQGIGQEQLNGDSLSACEQPQELSRGKFGPDGIKEVASEHSHLLQMNNEPLAEESGLLEKPTPENCHDADQPTRDSSKNETSCSNFPSQTSSKQKLEESYLEHQQGDSGIHNIIWHTHVGDSECLVSTTAESSLRSSKEQMTHSGVSGSSEPEYPLSHKTRLLVETENPENASFSADPQSVKSKEKEPQDCRLQLEKMNKIKPTKMGALMLDKQRTPDKLKPDVIALKCQLDAVPFSDEWFVALEAFGKDILELKTGTVQNSPTDKAPPEPGPWSPVKRKAQDIGPFECTKYSKDISASTIQENV